MPSRADWKSVTPFLLFCVLTYSTADFTFGLDTGTFGNLQSIPAFLNVFGEPNPKGGVNVLSTYRKSIMNSIVYVGRIVGVLLFEPVAERFGFKKVFIGLECLQLVAVIIELTSKNWIQLTAGRVLTYTTIGLIEAVIPSYCAEVAPAPLRGFFAGLFVPIQTSIGMLTSGVARAFATEENPIGWLLPVSLQGMPSIFGLALIWFTVESPRWLVQHGKYDEARVALGKLRTKEDVDAGLVEAEIEAIQQAVEYDATINQGTWKECFSGTYWRRAVYAGLMFAVYEAGGNQFYNAYGPSFLVAAGLGAKSFTYGILINFFGAVGGLMTIFAADIVGRRPLCIAGTAGLVIWCCLIGSIGGAADITTNATKQGVVVASFILLIFSTKISFATHSFIVTTEMGGVRMRKKLMMVGASQDVLWSFLTAYFVPYMQDDIGTKIGYIFAGISGIGFIYAIFFMPELKGRSLEEVDELFDNPRFRWAWQYAGVKTTGIGARIAEIEAHHNDGVYDVEEGIRNGESTSIEQKDIDEKHQVNVTTRAV